MRVSLTPTTVSVLEEISGKKITRNGDEIIREVAEMVEAQQKPDSPCWMESSCSEEDEDETP